MMTNKPSKVVLGLDGLGVEWISGWGEVQSISGKACVGWGLRAFWVFQCLLPNLAQALVITKFGDEFGDISSA